MSVFFGFGIAPSMFPESCEIARRPLAVDEVRELVAEGIVPCLNPSHTATIAVMRARFGLDVAIPERAPSVRLAHGDSVIVLGVSGLPRLEGRHEYTAEEIEGARFSFSIFRVA
ncbi:YddF family protein [Candidatus Bipolaricaulota bacterium]|nr:YddF family protein [Candidatus Bipolaricaulota bacterium]